MTTHIMLDLETWGKGPQAAIIQIGAVKFDPSLPVGERITDKFNVAIDPVSCQLYGLKFDASTLLWWMDPLQDTARMNWNRMTKVDIGSALDGFRQWYMGEGREPNESRPVWGNGVGFDNVILRNAYDALGLEVPWSYRDDRDFRTIKNLKDALGTPILAPQPMGIVHDALDDAIYQTQWLFDIAQATGFQIA